MLQSEAAFFTIWNDRRCIYMITCNLLYPVRSYALVSRLYDLHYIVMRGAAVYLAESPLALNIACVDILISMI
jgi:hypothetical protein